MVIRYKMSCAFPNALANLNSARTWLFYKKMQRPQIALNNSSASGADHFKNVPLQDYKCCLMAPSLYPEQRGRSLQAGVRHLVGSRRSGIFLMWAGTLSPHHHKVLRSTTGRTQAAGLIKKQSHNSVCSQTSRI